MSAKIIVILFQGIVQIFYEEWYEVHSIPIVDETERSTSTVGKAIYFGVFKELVWVEQSHRVSGRNSNSRVLRDKITFFVNKDGYDSLSSSTGRTARSSGGIF